MVTIWAKNEKTQKNFWQFLKREYIDNEKTQIYILFYKCIYFYV